LGGFWGHKVVAKLGPEKKRGGERDSKRRNYVKRRKRGGKLYRSREHPGSETNQLKPPGTNGESHLQKEKRTEKSLGK